MQRGNTVEGQVRKFLNAARAAIADSPIAKHTVQIWMTQKNFLPKQQEY